MAQVQHATQVWLDVVNKQGIFAIVFSLHKRSL